MNNISGNTMWIDNITQYLQKKHDENCYRKRIAISGGNKRIILFNNKCYLNFASNDYLGLSQHPDIIHAWQEGSNKFGIGSGGSGHIAGYSLIHNEFEQQLAHWLGYKRAILFTSGFAANQSVISCMLSFIKVVIADKLSHASIQEAAHLSCHNFYRFHHNNLISLNNICKKNIDKSSPLIISEGIFSMDGDIAPLTELRKITDRYQGVLMIDDAHGIGIISEQGKGCCNQHNIQADILIITFGKAFGVSGAAVLCNDIVAELLTQKARHLIYSTNIPSAQVYALQTALEIIQLADPERQKLMNNIILFRQLAAQVGIKLSNSSTAIQPYILGSNELAIKFAYKLREKGIWLNAILPPTVPNGKSRLRITLSAFHTTEDINYLVDCLACCNKEINCE